jgi:hypothetical protein
LFIPPNPVRAVEPTPAVPPTFTVFVEPTPAAPPTFTVFVEPTPAVPPTFTVFVEPTPAVPPMFTVFVEPAVFPATVTLPPKLLGLTPGDGVAADLTPPAVLFESATCVAPP